MSNLQPTHAVFFIQDITPKNSSQKKDKWTRIGSGWEIKNGRINIVNDFLPLSDGSIQVVPVALLDKNKKS